MDNNLGNVNQTAEFQFPVGTLYTLTLGKTMYLPVIYHAPGKICITKHLLPPPPKTLTI